MSCWDFYAASQGEYTNPGSNDQQRTWLGDRDAVGDEDPQRTAGEKGPERELPRVVKPAGAAVAVSRSEGKT